MKLKSAFGLLKRAFSGWQKDRVSLLAAALAYYTVLSIAPLIVIAIAIAGSVFGAEAAQGEIVNTLGGLIGTQGAQVVESVVRNAAQPELNSTASIFGVIALLISASGLFVHLQIALNIVWNVKAKKNRNLWQVLRKRLLSFGMVVAIGFLLLISLLVSTAISTLSQLEMEFIPNIPSLWQWADALISLGIVILLFALIYKYLPDVDLGWKNVWIGAMITAALFILGKYLLGFYISRSSIGSAYGAAGSLVVMLVWIFYSTQILLFGAELTQAYTCRHSHQVRPSRHATMADKS
ncbi:YihY/virulence factor BrkB family protein [cf. Phormidesmis sp. LEGE 11477]|uniref:YihY/virulence factor BrkB family protein n=1 Tax=cf. Phormidesmis sp. LEGE 11477 TaxID=1828680 RepID=UPI00187E3AEF|nr:YihY/virulence factor BrkB family protein [cf. Phormidesmis sp. LEGE 11477]MBE9060395.1 YihY/virulence factor BrkB family protein [cf. Phormidesmis sp. LEGE 11477]